LNKRITKS